MEFLKSIEPLTYLLILISAYFIYLTFDYKRKFKNVDKYNSYLICKGEFINALHGLDGISNVMIRLYRLTEKFKKLDKDLAKELYNLDIALLETTCLKDYYRSLFALPETIISEVIYRSCEREAFDLGNGKNLNLKTVLQNSLLPSFSVLPSCLFLDKIAIIYKRIIFEGVGAKKSPEDTTVRERWSKFSRDFLRDILAQQYNETKQEFLDEFAKLVDEQPKNKQIELLTLLVEEKFFIKSYLTQ